MQYRHPVNKDKQWVDWRDPVRREELFYLWVKWRVKWHDIDQCIITNGYAESQLSPTKKPMTKEQRCWFSMIYGMTYQATMSWIIYSYFPNFGDINLKDAEAWTNQTYRRQKYNKDCRYNQGKFHLQLKSIQEAVRPYGSLTAYFDRLVVDCEHQSFNNFYNAIQPFYKFGRMTTWLACQALFETANYPIRPKSVLASHPANWSVRSGLYQLFNRPEKKKSFNKDDVNWIKQKEDEVYKKSLEFVDLQSRPTWSNFQLESLICQYKKLVLGNEYSGLNTSNNLTYVKAMEQKWKSVNFTPFHETNRKHMHPLFRNYCVSQPLKKLSGLTGQLINLHQDFEFMPDMYKELGISPQILKSPKHVPILKKRIASYQKYQSQRFGRYPRQI